MNNNPSETFMGWPIKAYKNLDFLNSNAARSIRVQCELVEPECRLEKYGVYNTIVFFGSSRILDPETAKSRLEVVERELAHTSHPQPDQTKRLEKAKCQVQNAIYYTAAAELARGLTQWSLTIDEPHKRFLICSGGGPGIMEAANRGASEAGGRTIGLGISLPHEQITNSFITEELSFEFHYFFIRKYWFLYLAKTLLVFPGGFGTMDELFEMLTLLQTRKTQKYIPIVLFGSEFWNDVINFERLIQSGFIAEEDLRLFKIMDSVDETKDYIIKELTEHYLE